jgi:protein KRI1
MTDSEIEKQTTEYNSAVGTTVPTLKRQLELDESPDKSAGNAVEAKRAKIEDTEDADVDIIDTPERSHKLVQTVLAAKRDPLDDREGDDASASGDDEEFKLNINQEYARRFEYNKKRVEREQLERKYGAASSSESDSQSEDDDGEFATEALDKEIEATLKAIRDRDPRVFDENSKFYTEGEENVRSREKAKPEERPMYLHDYHRQNLLEGANDKADDVDRKPTHKSYSQEQADLKRDLIKSMNNEEKDGSSDENDEEDFLKPTREPSPPPERPTIPDVETADKDPETYLSNYFASRAWVPDSTSRFAQLESDDEEEERRAEEFEVLYNNRFEDPDEINRTLMTYSRTIPKEKSVRREERNARQRARDWEKEKKEQLKLEREEEKKRLKKLKLEEMEEKVAKIREASGLSGKNFNIHEWTDVLEADFDNEQWDEIMKKRFGDAYYAENQEEEDDENGTGTTKGEKKRKPKKPKWDDDIAIKDLIPDFDEAEAPDADLLLDSEDENEEAKASTSAAKKAKAARSEAKATQRRDRRILERIADQSVVLPPAGKKGAPHIPFRYREVSPNAFSLSTLDILAADDAQLNQFAGLKKLNSFRDAARKNKDRKKLGKKWRLKMWRREVFGRDEGPEREWLFKPGEKGEANADVMMGEGDKDKEDAGNIKEGERKKKKKRSRGKKHGRRAVAA